jgi:replicative DNA helicase
MNSLITASLNGGSGTALFSFPAKLMRKDERELVEWIRKYQIKYHTLPKLERLVANFPTFVPIDEESTPEEVVEEVLTRKRDLAIQEAVTRLLEREDDPLVVARDLESKLLSEPSEIISFSDFDRSAYFIDRSAYWLLTDKITKITGGIMDGELVYLVGRLGTGKTMLAQWAIYNWWMSGYKVLITSNEMPPLELMARFDGFVSGINPLSIRRREVGADDPRLASLAHIASCHSGNIFIPRNRPRCPSEIAALVDRVNPDVVVVDGVYLLKPDGAVNGKGSMWESVAEVSRSLKQMALDKNIPIIGVHQANRNAKEKVTAYDIAYSDAVGQDADIVVGISRGVEENDILIELVKNRGGPSVGLTVRMDFDTMSVNEEDEMREL